MRLWISLPLAALALNACQPMGSTSSASQAPRVPTLVQGVCGDCHAVQRPFQSPNPDAPSFDVIANSAGLNNATFNAWLQDAHNYPEEMEFELSEAEAREVVDYLLTLQRDDYTPEP